MARIIATKQMHVGRRGEGWTEFILADRMTTGALPMGARRWVLAPHARGPEVAHGGAEEMLYVIRGSGAVVVGRRRFPLEPESVLWLEPGDRYYLEAGADGLEVLQGCAP